MSNETEVEEVVSPHEEQQVAEQVVESMHQGAEDAQADEASQVVEEKQQQKMVPLTAMQKERKKRQELEAQLEYERQLRQQQAQYKAPEPIDDSAKYESATKEDLIKAQHEAIRIVDEKLWIKNNPEKFEKVNELLPSFLKQRPNLALAINSAQNRYEEAWTLMEALTPKQQQQLKAAPVQKREAPGAPTSVPKAAALNQAVDVMSMSDDEFAKWRSERRRKR